MAAQPLVDPLGAALNLKNARRRFEEIGYEVRGVGREYSFRRLGAARWISGRCLDAMLTAAMVEHTTTRKRRRKVNP